MKRLAIVVGIVLASALSSAAPPKVALEVWGLESGDELTIDGVKVNVRTAGAPRVFVGDPDATNAPVLHEVTQGKHELAVRRAACAPRAFTVTIEGTTKRVVRLEKQDAARCAIPFAPARR